MSRRIELELTSSRDDGTWTWRAAGAREPKGVLDGAILPSGVHVGDVLRADADFDIEGITVTAVLAPKAQRKEPERLELIGSGRDEPAVTTSLVGRKGRDRSSDDRRGGRGASRDGDRGRGGERGRGGDRGRDGDRGRGRRDRQGGAAGGERSGGSADRRPKRSAPPADAKPKPKRLRARRQHRDEVLAALPEEQRPVAEQVLRGGIPAVRQAVVEQNERARAEGRPEVGADAIVGLAEQILPRLREAEWLDRADAALAEIGDLDLRDLRSVVTAADAAARSPEAREQANALRTGLAERVEREHAAWLSEIATALRDERVVRALRLSSRPPKAGTPFPADLARSLTAAAAAALTADTNQERYALVLDALAYSPVREQVVPAGLPAEPDEALRTTIGKLASRIPRIAEIFGIAPAGRVPAPARPPAGKPTEAKPVPPPPSVTS